MKRYCLPRLYGDGEICWTEVPANYPDPEVGAESHEHPFMEFEGGVIIAVVDDASEVGKLLTLVEHLDSLVVTDGGFTAMLVQLLTVAAKGSDETAVVRAEVKQHFAESASERRA